MVQMIGLAVASVGLWTLRVALAAKGRKLTCAVVAAVEALVFVLTFSRLVTDLGTPTRLIGYVIGVAIGSIVGLALNDRVAGGHSELQFIAPGERPRPGRLVPRSGLPCHLVSGRRAPRPGHHDLADAARP